MGRSFSCVKIEPRILTEPKNVNKCSLLFVFYVTCISDLTPKSASDAIGRIKAGDHKNGQTVFTKHAWCCRAYALQAVCVIISSLILQ